MRAINDFIEWLKKLSKSTPFTKEFLFRADLRSSIYIGILVSVLEIWMIISAFTTKGDVAVTRDFYWIITHLSSYIFLLLTATLVLTYSILYLQGKKLNKTLGHIIKLIFSLGSLVFALYISYLSYDKSGLTFAFMTIGIYIFCLYNWHPIANLILSISFFLVFFYLQYIKGNLSYSMEVNGFTAWLILLVAGFNVYFQRKSDAQREEALQVMTDQLIEKNKKDALTGLHNMAHFNHAAEIILKSEFTDISKICFVFIDIENFKNYNEKYGFKAGSDFLKRASDIIKDVFKNSLSARFSDDHFVILAKKEGLSDKLSQLKLRIKYEESEINLGIKAGIYSPKEKSCSPSLACDHARYACTSIKKNYEVTFVEYDESMNDDFTKKQYIINNLDNAIQKKYIKVYYQPVVWASNGCLCGSEALARWDDPNIGFLSPAVFIPVLEEYHLIHKLDMFVLETVCSDIQEAMKKGTLLIPTSINFSRLDFKILNVVDEVERCVKKHGISRDSLHIEITESALNESDDKLKECFEIFREKGYSLWLDDFGSGYSGLNVLKDFNFDMMKIDMKFLYKFSENQKSQPILTSIVDLAKKIGMNTLTEGVETEEAYKFLKSIGCQRLQGYLFGKPMPKAEFEACIESGKIKLQK